MSLQDLLHLQAIPRVLPYHAVSERLFSHHLTFRSYSPVSTHVIPGVRRVRVLDSLKGCQTRTITLQPLVKKVIKILREVLHVFSEKHTQTASTEGKVTNFKGALHLQLLSLSFSLCTFPHFHCFLCSSASRVK